jgi:hypothetical protein
MQDQMNRIEEKLDKVIESHSIHHGRLVRLETQAGFVKAAVAFLGSIVLLIGGWLINRIPPH